MPDGQDPRVAAAQKRVGFVLKEKWRLDELLGVGGMAAVYAATHRNGKRVAVKMLHTEYAADAEVKSRFLREGYLVNRVEHPGVVGVLDDDGSEGSAFLVMELLEGESLEQRRQRKGGSLPPTEVLSVADQVLDVLVAAHAVEMVHRDLKPENLFLCKGGSVKLLDFGIARLRELSARIGATQAGGTTMGTPAFMPHEQARGNWDLVDGRTDLWALGATMFTLLTGQIVHEAPNVTDVLMCAMTKQPAPLSKRMLGAPPALSAVVDRALRFEQSERWPTARAMQVAVRHAYNEISGRGLPLLAPPVVELTGSVPANIVRAARAEAAAKIAARAAAAAGVGPAPVAPPVASAPPAAAVVDPPVVGLGAPGVGAAATAVSASPHVHAPAVPGHVAKAAPAVAPRIVMGPDPGPGFGGGQGPIIIGPAGSAAFAPSHAASPVLQPGHGHAPPAASNGPGPARSMELASPSNPIGAAVDPGRAAPGALVAPAGALETLTMKGSRPAATLPFSGAGPAPRTPLRALLLLGVGATVSAALGIGVIALLANGSKPDTTAPDAGPASSASASPSAP